jgi:hypothetical protein
MKLSYLILMLFCTLLVGSACTRKVVVVKRTPAAKLPPGQAKKVTGSQSARAYAPGQQKKRN